MNIIMISLLSELLPPTGFVAKSVSSYAKKTQTMLIYRGIHEKGSDDVVSAICYTKYTIYLSLCTQTAETASPDPFS